MCSILWKLKIPILNYMQVWHKRKSKMIKYLLTSLTTICKIRFSDHSLVEPFIKHHAIRSEFTSLDNTFTFYRIDINW
ncbi:hypothetical protein V1477_006903 [Vespula maculifrons]|uniref:Uncharacterized protein n=1 Tax=Vespula maculifrons TaxID=7453 RepID=A0ABD2CH79_VESMC